jgi:holliday junction DNA helicase RuvA
MIGWLQGTARSERLIVTESGVGYVVTCVTPPSSGDVVELYVTTVVRQDSLDLYGFGSEVEQLCFEALVKASGVGPSVALMMLSSIGVAGVAAAVEAEDTKRLTSVKGVGPGLAKKMLASVKLPELVRAEAGVDDAGPSDPVVESLVEALVGLGFDSEDSRLAAGQAREGSPDGGVDQLLAVALAAINRAAA